MMIHIIIHLSILIECITERVNHNVNYELELILMCHYRFISYSKCVILVGDVGNGGGYECVGAGGRWKIFAPYP